MTRRQMHINVNVQGAGAHPAAWRAPDGNRFGSLDIAHFQEIARIAERGKLDAIFLADALANPGDPSGSPMWALDPIVILTAMAVATSRIGFIGTASTTFSHPYNLARSFLSLDHISGGRVGWNVVTTYDEAAAPNFGLNNLPPREHRYDAAAEFVEVVQKLWDSWEDEALRADTVAGIYGDAAKIHAIDHEGAFYKVRGPLQVPRSPQGRPLLVQAGSSPEGRALAARVAEAVFCIHQDISDAQGYYSDVKARAAGFGRNPAELSILPGVSLIIGGTEEEAWARKRRLDETGGPDAALARLAGRLGVPLEALHPDRPVPEEYLGNIARIHGTRGFADATLALAARRDLTASDLIRRGAGGHRLIVGTPGQIADEMETWFNEGAADGFNIMSDIYPGGLEDFVGQVVPELQARGIFRRDYEGTTLRDHYGLSRPGNLLTAGQSRGVAAR